MYAFIDDIKRSLDQESTKVSIILNINYQPPSPANLWNTGCVLMQRIFITSIGVPHGTPDFRKPSYSSYANMFFEWNL